MMADKDEENLDDFVRSIGGTVGVGERPAIKAEVGPGPLGRFLRGAFAETLPVGNLPLSPEAQSATDAASQALRKLPMYGAMAPFVMPTVSNIAGQAQSGNWAGALGAVTADMATMGGSKLLKPLVKASGIAPWLRTKAASQYGRVLAPTTKINKALAEEKVVPGAIQRRTTAFTFQGLKKKVGSKVEEIAQELDQAWKDLPPESEIDAVPVFREIQQRIGKTYISGSKIVENPALKKQLELINNKLTTLIGEQTALTQVGRGEYRISAESARSWRQMMDKFVDEKTGWILQKTGPAEMKAKEIASNALRREIAKEYPDIKKINAEFSFWKTFQDLLKATNTRRMGQTGPLTRNMAAIAGGAAGLSSGGVGKAAVDAVIMASMEKTFRSTGWRTISATTKDLIADALAAGKFGTALLLMKQTGLAVSPTPAPHRGSREDIS